MTDDASSFRYLNRLPLWRLLVMLDDSERFDGPNSPTSQMLARLIRERLSDESIASKGDRNAK
jgi:hypothetical protein